MCKEREFFYKHKEEERTGGAREWTVMRAVTKERRVHMKMRVEDRREERKGVRVMKRRGGKKTRGEGESGMGRDDNITLCTFMHRMSVCNNV